LATDVDAPPATSTEIDVTIVAPGNQVVEVVVGVYFRHSRAA
jgi:hypothetical protein